MSAAQIGLDNKLVLLIGACIILLFVVFSIIDPYYTIPILGLKYFIQLASGGVDYLRIVDVFGPLVLTAFLIHYYRKTTSIQDAQTDIAQRQKELVELEYEPLIQVHSDDLYLKSSEGQKSVLSLSVSNFGKGVAANLQTRMSILTIDGEVYGEDTGYNGIEHNFSWFPLKEVEAYDVNSVSRTDQGGVLPSETTKEFATSIYFGKHISFDDSPPIAEQIEVENEGKKYVWESTTVTQPQSLDELFKDLTDNDAESVDFMFELKYEDARGETKTEILGLKTANVNSDDIYGEMSGGISLYEASNSAPYGIEEFSILRTRGDEIFGQQKEEGDE